MIYLSYILKSLVAQKTYVGHTDNLEKRLRMHNSGRTVFSSRYRPWIVIHSEEFDNEFDAIKREKYFKSAAGRRWLKKNLFKEVGSN